MVGLRYKFNYANKTLLESSGSGSVGVHMKDGSVSYVRWLGFIDVSIARNFKGAVPVKLDVQQYTQELFLDAWQDVPQGRFVQGCLVEEGVCGVTKKVISIV